MSVAPTRGPVQRPGDDRDFNELFQRVGDLESFPPGRWIYAGTYPGDANTTPDSPAFQNGISGVVRFRRTNGWNLQVEADIVDMSPGDVVTNIAAFYRPPNDGHGVGMMGDTGVTMWKITTTGDLIYLGSLP